MAAPSVDKDDWTPWRLDGAVELTTQAASGARYRLGLSIPQGEPPPSGFPLLIVLDGGALFASASALERRLSRRPAATGVQPTIVLGIGHVQDKAFDGDPRRRDYTYGPCSLLGEPAVDGPIGGAPAFQAFLNDVALPLVRRRTTADPARIGLFGHSMAGLFVLETLARQPASYRAFIAASPSLWWSSEETIARLTALPRGSAQTVLILAGALEAPTSERQRRRAMIDNVKRADEALASAAVDQHRFIIVPDADHGSIVDPGLRAAFKLLGMTEPYSPVA